MTATDNSSSISQEFGRKHLVNDVISTIILIALISPCLNVPSAICARIYLASLTSAAQVQDQWPDEHFLLCTCISSDCTLQLLQLARHYLPSWKGEDLESPLGSQSLAAFASASKKQSGEGLVNLSPLSFSPTWAACESSFLFYCQPQHQHWQVVTEVTLSTPQLQVFSQLPKPQVTSFGGYDCQRQGGRRGEALRRTSSSTSSTWSKEIL